MHIHILYEASDGFAFNIKAKREYQFSDGSYDAREETVERFKKLGHTVTTGYSVARNTDVLVLESCVHDSCTFGSLGTLLLLMGRPFDFFCDERLLHCTPILIYNARANNKRPSQLIRGSIADNCTDEELRKALEEATALRQPRNVQ